MSLVTLGVRDLARAKRFYAALGWRGQEVQETVFFQAGGIAVVLWSRAALAADAGLAPSDPADEAGSSSNSRSGDAGYAFGGIVLAHNVRSRAEVDEILARAGSAGGTVVKPAEETFYGGYAGVFLDTEGHPWEVAHNPGFTLTEEGALVLPDFDAG
nr:VOC family protein [Motilibacter deserti]